MKTILYKPILKPYFNDESEQYGLVVQFDAPCVRQDVEHQMIVLDEQDIANILATFNPLFNSIEAEVVNEDIKTETT